MALFLKIQWQLQKMQTFDQKQKTFFTRNSEPFEILETPSEEKIEPGLQQNVSEETLQTYFKTIPGIQNITSSTVIKPLATVVFVQGSGGAVTIANNPSIMDGLNGQILVIIGQSDVNTVTLTDGNGMRLAGNVTLGQYDTITLIFDAVVSNDWIELCRSNN